jgi:hypothetical protein
MITKEDIDKGITHIIESVRNAPVPIVYLPFFPKARKRVEDLLNNCVDLQKELVTLGNDINGLIELQKKFFELESDYRRQRGIHMLVPTVILVYFGFFVIIFGIRLIPFSSIVKQTLGVEAPEKLIVLGIAGAFLYLATQLLSKTESLSGTDSQLAGVANFGIRLSLAIIVPIILVVLFFTKNGEVADFHVSPELLSFACGYSARLVVELFNKLVERASKLIQAM